jgi:hypothetical protein
MSRMAWWSRPIPTAAALVDTLPLLDVRAHSHRVQAGGWIESKVDSSAEITVQLDPSNVFTYRTRCQLNNQEEG